MPKICYIEKNFNQRSLELIDTANGIIEEYEAEGYDLTLRQLYYQFVARDIIPNKDTEYKRLGSIISDARLAGLVDWTAITDRTRYVRTCSHWDTPAEIIESAASSYAIDKWDGQQERCEVWIEKDALIGVIERTCQRLDVPCFSCRGYVSQSEMWVAAMRLKRWTKRGVGVTIFHLGDHDPSGIDMTRDIQDRVQLLAGTTDIRIERIALNMDQIEEYGPPPNPAKVTDSRAGTYIAEHGNESWELDSLDPKVLDSTVEEAVGTVMNKALWKGRQETQEAGREMLTRASRAWADVVDFLNQ